MKLIETNVGKYDVFITESSKLPANILARVTYPIMLFGVKNANERKYSKEVAETLLNDPAVKQKIENRTLFGNAEHPAESQVKLDPDHTSHIVSNIYIKDNVLKADFDILPTKAGKFIYCLLEAGCNVGVSTRADGELEESVEEDGSKCYNVIPSCYKFATTDFTGDPSTPGSLPENIIKTALKEYESHLIDKDVAVALLETFKTDASKSLIEKIKMDKQHKECKCGVEGKHCNDCKLNLKEESLHLVDYKGRPFYLDSKAQQIISKDNPKEIISFDDLSKEEIEALTTVKEAVLEVIVQVGNKWEVKSNKGRSIGSYNTIEEAKKRIKEAKFGSIEWQNEQVAKIKYKLENNIPLDGADEAFIEVQTNFNDRLGSEELVQKWKQYNLKKNEAKFSDIDAGLKELRDKVKSYFKGETTLAAVDNYENALVAAGAPIVQIEQIWVDERLSDVGEAKGNKEEAMLLHLKSQLEWSKKYGLKHYEEVLEKAILELEGKLEKEGDEMKENIKKYISENAFETLEACLESVSKVFKTDVKDLQWISEIFKAKEKEVPVVITECSCKAEIKRITENYVADVLEISNKVKVLETKLEAAVAESKAFSADNIALKEEKKVLEEKIKAVSQQLISEKAELSSKHDAAVASLKSEFDVILKESDSKLKKLEETIVVLKSESEAKLTKTLLERYVDLKLKLTGLSERGSFKTLFESCKSESEVDVLLESIKGDLRYGLVHSAGVKGVKVEETKTNKIQDTIDEGIANAFSGMRA